MIDAAPPFRGFSPDAFAFLETLAAEQNRDWFVAHKAAYERNVQAPMSGLVAALGLALAANGLDLACDPKRAIFRIYRDVRFSKDKRPYKTHIGAAMTRDGEKMAPGVLYIHVDPKGSFAASGFFQPEPPHLHAIRQRIVTRPDEFRDIVGRLERAGYSLGRDDALTRAPRGFEAVTAPEVIDLLRLKSLIVSQPLPRDLLADGDALIAALTRFGVAAQPLLRFGWAAL
jgi:uncharacterized protein (TIGR02453 family)